jgi:hypothetical protein
MLSMSLVIDQRGGPGRIKAFAVVSISYTPGEWRHMAVQVRLVPELYTWAGTSMNAA